MMEQNMTSIDFWYIVEYVCIFLVVHIEAWYTGFYNIIHWEALQESISDPKPMDVNYTICSFTLSDTIIYLHGQSQNKNQ